MARKRNRRQIVKIKVKRTQMRKKEYVEVQSGASHAIYGEGVSITVWNNSGEEIFINKE